METSREEEKVAAAAGLVDCARVLHTLARTFRNRLEAEVIVVVVAASPCSLPRPLLDLAGASLPLSFALARRDCLMRCLAVDDTNIDIISSQRASKRVVGLG